ncbi:hypothetical protein [Cyanobacterium sp. uoEpiScrs1]|uniref:hypothetical protein n=1 Tax=Cyanobacterium sp. uoEpiScrs1 TaxID=2976343 RepID=UPI00226AD497|nr:hypothetical protein [Cyanobacterium sp. uoEpiScrs1]
MTEILSNLGVNPTFYSLFVNLKIGEINLETGLLWLAISMIISIIGGAIGGMLLAGKDIGYQLSAMLGSLLGPAGVIPVVTVGLVFLKYHII